MCLPPLRERGGDIPLLIAALTARVERRTGMKAPLFAPDALEAMGAWSWPGNVRELAHLVERMTILHPGGVVAAADLPPEMRARTPLPAAGDKDGVLARLLAPDMDFKSARAAFETYYLEAKLAEAGGNITRLAETVGLERSYVHRKLKAARAADGEGADGEGRESA